MNNTEALVFEGQDVGEEKHQDKKSKPQVCHFLPTKLPLSSANSTNSTIEIRNNVTNRLPDSYCI